MPTRGFSGPARSGAWGGGGGVVVGHDHVRAIFADSISHHTRSWNFSRSLLGSLWFTSYAERDIY